MKIIDGVALKNAVMYAAAFLEANKEEVNRLNVFPVPDGDTGTNMSLTISSAAKKVQATEEDTVKAVAKAMSSGALMGARGNSGVILSQLFRGFADACKDRNTLNVTQLASCFINSSNMAYKAVIKPTEGTILTVARMMAEFAGANFKKYDSVVDFLTGLLESGAKALEMTPEMLPVLKEAGVVDAGGKGLLYIYEGMLAAFKGEPMPVVADFSSSKSAVKRTETERVDIEFLYCTEVMVQGDATHAPALRTKIAPLGDSMIVIGDDDIIKVHIHTNDPGKVLSYAVGYGEMIDIKIENMKLQHENVLVEEANAEADERPKERSKYAFIAVLSGDGMEQIFYDLGVARIIKGGQTMNPSTQDFLDEIAKVNADTIYLLPNNKNIIMAAKQAKEISDENIVVIETRTIPQGITALVSFAEGLDEARNTENMTEGIKNVRTGEVTFSVRDTSIEGIEIKEGDIIGMVSGKGIQAVNNTPEKVVLELIAGMVNDESELLYVYYGADTSEKDAEKLQKKLEKAYGDMDVIVQYGGQPLYYYIVSVE